MAKPENDTANLLNTLNKNIPTLVLDRSALITESQPWRVFTNVNFLIPISVINSLDRAQKERTAAGVAARRALLSLDQAIKAGTVVPGGSTLRTVNNNVNVSALLARHLDPDSTENKILGVCLGLLEEVDNVQLISSNAALRIKAREFGIPTMDISSYAGSGVGWESHYVDQSLVEAIALCDFYTKKTLSFEDIAKKHKLLENFLRAAMPAENQFMELRGDFDFKIILQRKGDSLLYVNNPGVVQDSYIKPRTTEQALALELLMDKNVQVVGLGGPAGTGKTLLALGASLYQILGPGAFYSKLMVIRPTTPLADHNVGFLPGTLDEKLAIWADPIFDNLSALKLYPSGKNKNTADKVGHVATSGEELRSLLETKQLLEMGSIAHLRGRSFMNKFIIVDEAQNCDVAVLKLLLTRVGKGSKIVFTGDTDQVDGAFLSKNNNALAALEDTFSGRPYFGYINLTNCERSQIANDAARLL